MPHTDVFNLLIVRSFFQIIEDFMVTQAVPPPQHSLFYLSAIVSQCLIKLPQVPGKTIDVCMLVIKFECINNQVGRFLRSLNGTVVLF